MSEDTVALVLDKDEARRVKNGECLNRSHLKVLQGDPSETDVVLILENDSIGDGTAMAKAIVDALGILPRTMIIDADATIPEGFVHRHFVEVGQDPTRTTRGQRVDEVIPPVTFCEDASERT